MEIIPYLFSVLLTALVLYWSGFNASRKPGAPVTGLFRYRDRPAPPAGRRPVGPAPDRAG